MLIESKMRISGGKPVVGEIVCGGAKNLALKLIVASILTRSVNHFKNMPNIVDLIEVIGMCQKIGVVINYDGHSMTVDSQRLTNNSLRSDAFGNRISILFLSVLGHFFDSVSVPIPRGCSLGSRAINIHIDILEQFGFEVELTDQDCRLSKRRHPIVGQNIALQYPSVGATETAIFLAVLAKGKSVISNIAIEPEVQSLILFLQQCGSKIHFIGDREILIEGVPKLAGSRFIVTGDRLEAAGWACIACGTGGRIVIDGIDPNNMLTFLGPFRSLGGGFEIIDQSKVVFFKESAKLHPIFLETGPYPAFSTDFQPMLAVLMSQATGSSVIHETLFESRLGYLANLTQFGINSTQNTQCYGNSCRFAKLNHNHSAIINGNTDLYVPQNPIITDNIRSGFAYLIAASIASGDTVIMNSHLIKRGIADLESKLQTLGLLHEYQSKPASEFGIKQAIA